MLFYGHSSHVNFSSQLEAVTAYLALHFIMIHLIRVIKLIWLRCCSSADCVTFIHCKRTWKWSLKENEVLTWHITACPSKLVDCNLYLHPPPPHKDRTVSFIFFSVGKDFDVMLKSTSRIVLWFPRKLKPLHHVATTFQSVWWDKWWISECNLRMMQHLCQLLLLLIVKRLSGSHMCRGRFPQNKHSLAHFCYLLFGSVLTFVWSTL